MKTINVNFLNEGDAAFRKYLLEMINKYSMEFAGQSVDVDSNETMGQIFAKKPEGLKLLYMALHITQFPITEFMSMDVGALVLRLSDNRDGELSKKQALALITAQLQQRMRRFL